MHPKELPVQGEGIGENMKYCVDNSLCPFKRQSGSIMECSAVEYCVFQRPNALASPNTWDNPYEAAYCQCGGTGDMTTTKFCHKCGKFKW